MWAGRICVTNRQQASVSALVRRKKTKLDPTKNALSEFKECLVIGFRFDISCYVKNINLAFRLELIPVAFQVLRSVKKGEPKPSIHLRAQRFFNGPKINFFTNKCCHWGICVE